MRQFSQKIRFHISVLFQEETLLVVIDLMQLKMNGYLFIDGRNQCKTDFIQSKGFKYVQIGVKE